jgi:hypothetical protein
MFVISLLVPGGLLFDFERHQNSGSCVGEMILAVMLAPTESLQMPLRALDVEQSGAAQKIVPLMSRLTAGEHLGDRA